MQIAQEERGGKNKFELESNSNRVQALKMSSRLRDECCKALEVLIENMDSKRQEKSVMVFNKALRQLKGDLSTKVENFNDILKVRGIGPAIQKAIYKQLNSENKLEELGIPRASFDKSSELPVSRLKRTKNSKEDSDDMMEDENEEDENATKKKRTHKKRKYVPKSRSGGYAILLALLSQFYKYPHGMTKNEIIDHAIAFCDLSFQSNPSTNEYYNAWSSMKTLINNEVVAELNVNKKPQRFGLTDDGFELADTLKKVNNVVFDNEKDFSRKWHAKTSVSTSAKTSNSAKGNNPNSSSLTAGNTSDASIGEVSEFSANLSLLLQKEKETLNQPLPKARLWKTQSILQDLPKKDDLFSTQDSVSNKNIQGLERNIEPLCGYADNIIRARYNGVSYEVWDIDSFDIILCIDNREIRARAQRDYFATTLAAKGVHTEIRNLHLADFVWIGKHKKTGKECCLNYFIERKRLDDLSDSIKDHRFTEQKHRLQKLNARCVFYLVEEITALDLGAMAEAVKTSMWQTIIYSGFHVQRTKNSEDTVVTLKNINDVLVKKFKKTKLLVIKPSYFENQDAYAQILEDFRAQFERKKEAGLECCHTFDSYQNIMGKTNLLTVKEAYLVCLLSVKGVSLEKALGIQSLFPTLKSLLLAYQKCKDEVEGKKMIMKAMEEFPGNKKVKKALSETLYNVFGSL
ncbi:hypothetical protein ACO0RG_004036 [Hanseniaspora osmophila]